MKPFSRQGPILTKHVLERLALRGVTVDDVRTALNNHDITYPGTHRTRATEVRVGTVRDGRRLAVVVDKKKPRVVVTAMWKG